MLASVSPRAARLRYERAEVIIKWGRYQGLDMQCPLGARVSSHAEVRPVIQEKTGSPILRWYSRMTADRANVSASSEA